MVDFRAPQGLGCALVRCLLSSQAAPHHASPVFSPEGCARELLREGSLPAGKRLSRAGRLKQRQYALSEDRGARVFVTPIIPTVIRMNSAADLLRRIDDPNLSVNERAQLRCHLARDLEEAGDYEAARSAMGELWQQVGERPKIEGLDRRTAAEVILCVGSLSGWIGGGAEAFE